MRFSGLLAVVLGALVQFISPSVSRANIYDAYFLSSANANRVVGIDATGDVFLYLAYYSYLPSTYMGPCGLVANAPECYSVFNLETQMDSATPTLSGYAMDDGSRCSPTIPGFDIRSAQCSSNGEYAIFSAWINNDTISGVWIGSLLTHTFTQVPAYTMDGAFINNIGDAVFTDGTSERIIAMAHNTPEPGSLILLATGALSMIGVLRRRISQ